MQAMCPIALILRSPNVHVKPILHINNEDVTVTKQIVEAGKLLDIQVLDHLIVARQNFASLREKGLGFS